VRTARAEVASDMATMAAMASVRSGEAAASSRRRYWAAIDRSAADGTRERVRAWTRPNLRPPAHFVSRTIFKEQFGSQDTWPAERATGIEPA
jgi:hypothetical protein